MWILLSFLNVTFAYLAEKNYENNKLMCKLFLLLLVVANVIIIGLRDIGVGIDSAAYIDDYFTFAQNLSIRNFFLDDVYDKGFVVLALIANLINNNPVALLFVTECFIIVFITLGLYEFKKTISYSIFWFMILFCILYLYETVNLMRQLCAMSLLFYGYALFLQKRYVAFGICLFISFFFHSSSVLFLLVIIAQLVSNTKIKYWYAWGCIAFFIVCIFYYYTVLSYFGGAFLKEEYITRYGKGSIYTTTGDLGVGYRIYFMLFVELIICYWLYKKKIISDELLFMIFLLCSVEFLAIQMRFVMTYFIRIAYYYGIIKIVYISSLFKYKGGLSILLYAYLAIIFSLSFYMFDERSIKNYKLNYKSRILDIKESNSNIIF